MRFKEFYYPKDGIRHQWVRDKRKKHREEFFKENGFYREDLKKYPSKGHNQLKEMYINL